MGRVERRDYMTGSGMMTDPERIQDIEDQRHHSDLNARLPPKTTFKQVMNAPPKVPPRAKRERPRSNAKLRPSATHPSQQMVGFADTKDALDALLDDADKPRIILKA